jgi:phosphoribosylanthranilate isomerase
MRVRVKICGLRTAEAVTAAVRCGADALGFVFSTSPRRIAIPDARALAAEIPPFVARVAVLWNPDAQGVLRVCESFGPDVVQCEPDRHGAAPHLGRAAFLAVLHDGPDVAVHAHALPAGGAVLLDSAGQGGRGVAPDWRRAAAIARTRPLVLAGGLTPENVGGAIRTVCPYAVDVSSGVESSPGVKDPALIERFIEAVRRAGDATDGGGVTWSSVLGC